MRPRQNHDFVTNCDRGVQKWAWAGKVAPILKRPARSWGIWETLGRLSNTPVVVARSRTFVYMENGETEYSPAFLLLYSSTLLLF